jgi:hypothetical protein
MDNDPISRLLDAASAGTGIPQFLYAEDAVLDATVPMWRFEAHGAAAVAAQLSGWYADPGTLTELVREPLPGGEVVRFTLEWIENGEPWAAHQVHFIASDADRITRQQSWCGGRWPAALLAEIETGLLGARAAS